MGNVTAFNRDRLVGFFRSGEKGTAVDGMLGVEVEHHVLGDDGAAIAYEARDGRVGVRQVLEHLAAWYPERIRNEDGELLGLMGDEGSVTLEPSAQLEISVAPYASVADVARSYRHFRAHADDFLARHGAHLESWGYNPAHRAQDLTLIPKRRYDFMDAYFESIGSHGDRMMRASASTQVSVDYADEADAVRKMRVAAALAPILAAMADNTPVFEGRPNHLPIRRLELWREVDGLRCGTVPGVFDEGFGYERYADWLLATPPIFVTRPAADDPEGPSLRPYFDVPASEAYADAPLSAGDVEHVISMFWPDVRLKRFVEVRPADCLPEAQVLAYTALIKGLFYSEASLSAIEEELGVDSRCKVTRGAWPLTKRDVDEAIARIQVHGFAGVVYGKALSSWEPLLLGLAHAGLPKEERHFLDPLAEFARDKPWWQVTAL